MNTKAGGQKMKQTMLDSMGEDGLRAYYEAIGRKGGTKSRGGGFASQLVDKNGLTGSERAKIAGAKGGRARRKLSKVTRAELEAELNRRAK